ncbi:MAG: hypothetical protein HY854_23505 [Burkholderiales bacterium]|nr:hypothetical protein [Burkholderiales bacterium]
MMKAKLRNQVAGLALLAPVGLAFVAQPAAAQQQVSAPRITGMSLNADNGLDPGSVLRIEVRGTPGGAASANFGKTDIRVGLRETESGVYRARYTVQRDDRIDPTSTINVRLTRGEVTTRHSFTYPPSFQALAMGAAAASPPGLQAVVPRIERFTTVPVARLEPGRELRYRVHGAPGAVVTLDIPGVASDLPMREAGPGVYEGTYTIRQRDDLDAFSTAIATLRTGERWVMSRLERAFVRDRDQRAPTISNLSPQQGDIVSPVGTTLIAGELDDGAGSGVDPRSVRLVLNGRDVTPQVRVTPDRFEYRADLPPGHHTVDVTVRDFSGKVVSRTWRFDVGQSRVAAAPPGAMPLHLAAPAHGAQVDANGDLVVRGATVPWATVRIRVEAVPPVFGQMLGVAQLVYSDTVEADRDGRFSVRVQPRIPVVPGMRYDVSVMATRGDQAAESRITLHQRG